MNKSFWKSDWFVGLAVVAGFVVLAGGSSLLDALERKAYDVGVTMTSRQPSDRIAIIAIDQPSIDNIGRWPWPRDIHAEFIDKLAAAKPKVIASTVFFTEPQQDRGAVYINQLRDLFNKQYPPVAAGTPVEPAVAAAATPAEVAPAPAAPPSVVVVSSAPPEMQPFGQLLDQAAAKLDFDQQLSASMGRAGNVLLPLLLDLGEPQGNPDHPTAAFVERNQVQPEGNPEAGLPAATRGLFAPIEKIGAKAAGLGHLNVVRDPADGVVRSEALAMRYYDQFYPSFSLAVAAKSLNVAPDQIKLMLGESVTVGGLRIPTSRDSSMLTYFYKDHADKPAFMVDSFFDVASGKIPADKYRDKIVLIGATALGVGDTMVTPVSASTSPVVLLAHTVSSILQQDYFVQPAWGEWVTIGLFFVVALYLILLLPRLKAAAAAALTASLLILMVGGHFGLMISKLTWVPLMTPAALLLVGHLLLTTKRFLVTEKGKERSEAESAESNRMLGLAFQGQGQLDMAFDKLRKVPATEPGMMDILYNLALDFERKRQFNKAQAVYEYMSGVNPKYKDLDQKLNRARQMSETVILGGGNSRGNASTLVLDQAAVEKPMLGRYQVEKELGKGAMGVVYLGKDPKIGRVVAIKTMALSQEFEAEELEDARSRFFREAETAGRLNHPNIVTIYDAGEEHDLAYIAMEFLKGKDLAPHVKAGQLLPLKEVLDIVRQVAEALDYAHLQHVVHRDIKPANIMYEGDTHTVKVTDFGIARITDSSKTKTGMVLGTPSYMSPEQLSGKKIDGRSDLFSLGVMLYQMTVGALPFQGDSMAELMFRIANDPYRNPKDLNPNLPDSVVTVIDRALQKDPSVRFQTGSEFAMAVKNCLAES